MSGAYRLKPEVVAVFDQLGESAREALAALLEGVQGRDEYVEENTHGGDFDINADYGLTDWDIDLSERGQALVSALSDVWDECKFCGGEIKHVWGEGIETGWIDKTGNRFCLGNVAHKPEDDA